MYSGDELPFSNVAKIKSDSKYVSIVRVDGKMTYDLFEFLINGGWPRVIDVMPGKHNLRVSYKFILTYYANIWVVANPGQVYILKHVAKNGRVVFWIEDEKIESN